MPIEKVNSKVVKAVLTPGAVVLARRGAMLFYTGDVQFRPHTAGGGAGAGMGGVGGLVGMAGRAMAGESVPLMAAQVSGVSGHGEVHYGHAGLHVVDPQAYVGHLGTLQVDVSASAGWRDTVGKGSGEAVQLKVSGHGTVFVQASEQKF